MQFSVMPTAERYGELIADLQTNAARLCKSKMMRVAWLSAADKNMAAMQRISDAPCHATGEDTTGFNRLSVPAIKAEDPVGL